MVSLPDFNPNFSINPKTNSYRNTATLNLYEMGSTFKVFTIAAAFEHSEINLSSNFDASKPLRVSPKYSSVTDCDRDFGEDKCEMAPQRTTAGGSVFMPMMMGYMMGSMLSGGRGMMPQPLYRSMDDVRNFRTGDNQKVSSKTGITRVSKGLTRTPSTKTRTIRRGGFGAAARSVGARFSTAGKFRRFGGFRSFGG